MDEIGALWSTWQGQWLKVTAQDELIINSCLGGSWRVVAPAACTFFSERLIFVLSKPRPLFSCVPVNIPMKCQNGPLFETPWRHNHPSRGARSCCSRTSPACCDGTCYLSCNPVTETSLWNVGTPRLGPRASRGLTCLLCLPNLPPVGFA